MRLESSDISRKSGFFLGFVVMFFVSTILLYYLLLLSHKLPATWNYFYIFLTALAVVLLGVFLKLILK